MSKMTVIYQTPKDAESFEQHYFNVHIPLAKQLPGLIKYEINDNAILSTTGHSPYRIANLYFESMEAIKNEDVQKLGRSVSPTEEF